MKTLNDLLVLLLALLWGFLSLRWERCRNYNASSRDAVLISNYSKTSAALEFRNVTVAVDIESHCCKAR